MHPHERHMSGSQSELYVASRLIGQGYQIFWPMMTQSKADFIALLGKETIKVQVKKATWSTTQNHKYLQARVMGKSTRDPTKLYKEGEVDLFAFTDNQRVWLAPWEEAKGLTSVCLDGTKEGYKPQSLLYNPDTWLL